MTTAAASGVAARAPDACPVCRAPAPKPFLSVDGRDYWRCATCEASFLDPRQRPQPEAERAYYLNHENRADDPAYRRFLSKAAVPLMERLEPGAKGLDYGCGPGPALAAMLEEAGHPMALYDPFFHPDPAALDQVYDFVTCTETAEHFHYPAEEFDRLSKLLRPGGWLAIMTCFQTEDARFAGWHYRRDPTHVVFYREATMGFIAGSRGWSCEVPAKDVALMRKPGEAA
ncbi:class I SAM-dependent methyltransferase [Chelativorans salis]|uniref:Class I SAM-dependent methyltransferase n=1 Tax=Chelativorans salis TaxID=2978478 RepID=A0ABT2LI74_9HYPH|nr:class I SAM-dependent methyltransferase [Chelativorans sp. EGI FJ00035]MCT7373694.1 class I SAM-dependent methyltransferase [Chelativorans sp. EGI FJ00035]